MLNELRMRAFWACALWIEQMLRTNPSNLNELLEEVIDSKDFIYGLGSLLYHGKLGNRSAYLSSSNNETQAEVMALLNLPNNTTKEKVVNKVLHNKDNDGEDDGNDDGDEDEGLLEGIDNIDWAEIDDALIGGVDDEEAVEEGASLSTVGTNLQSKINWKQRSCLLENVEVVYGTQAACPNPNNTVIIEIDPGERYSMTVAKLDLTNPTKREILRVSRNYLHKQLKKQARNGRAEG
ncbi:hypothetical protein BGZ76_010113 [Entomortierella beljakovae]|nr:hypothetical protein BGZ76_010113 [Entomortierella beljakovae]